MPICNDKFFTTIVWAEMKRNNWTMCQSNEKAIGSSSLKIVIVKWINFYYVIQMIIKITDYGIINFCKR